MPIKTLVYHPQKTFLNKMYLFSNFFDELLTTVDQNVQSVASYEGVNGVNRLATKGKKYYDYRQNAKKITDYRQENY